MALGTGKTVFITGASSGIGLELARLFGRDGFNLVLLARHESELEKVARQLAGEYKIQVQTIVKDLSHASAAQEVFGETQKRNLPIDILVNNAGFGARTEFIHQAMEEISSMIELNIAALTALTRLYLPQMCQRGYGKILNVASTAAFQPGPYMAVYYATKAYGLSFSEALRFELRNTPITVTTLCPGPTQTNFSERAQAKKILLFSRRQVMGAPEVALAGYKGFMQGKSIVFPGWENRFGAFLVRLAPRQLVLKAINRVHREV